MPTAIVNGAATDIGLNVLASQQLELLFAPSEAAVALGSHLFLKKPVVATPGADGTFSVPLAPTELFLRDDIYYTIRARWLNPFGWTGGGYTEVDYPDLKLRVPIQGGPLADLLGPVATSTVIWWVSLVPPVNAAPNTYWLNADPDDPTLGTGDVQKWS